MKKLIFLLIITTIAAAVVGFSIDFQGTSFLRILSLITADLLIILLLGKLFFQKKQKLKAGRIVAS